MSAFTRRTFVSLQLASLTGLVSGCGGGGKSAEARPDEGAPPPPPPPPPQSSPQSPRPDSVAALESSAVAGGTVLPAWMTAPVGQWAEIPNTAAPGELFDYSGVGWRNDASTVEAFSALGGGHAGNNSNNRAMVLTLTADVPTWKQVRATSDFTGYDGDTMAYLPSDGSPGPRHLYNGIVWSAARQEYVIGGLYWGKAGSGSYRTTDGFRRDTNAYAPQGTYPLRYDYASAWSVVDPSTGYLYSTEGNNSYQNVGKKMNPTTLAISDWHPASGPMVARGPNAFDTKRNKIFQLGPSNYDYWSSTLCSATIDPRTGAKTAISFNPSTEYKEFIDDLPKYLSACMVYDDAADCFYWYNGDDGQVNGKSNRIYKIVPNATTTWDMTTIVGAGVTVPSSRGGTDPVNNPASYVGTLTFFHFARQWNAALLVRPGRNVHYLRLPYSWALSVRSGSVSGTVPYTAALLPLRGELPRGFTLASADDPTLSASIVSTHSDGSAAVVVVAGEIAVAANSIRALELSAVAADAVTTLTPSRIATLVGNVTVNFGGSYGTATLTNFSQPAVVWWANANVICASYRVAAPSPGATALEAVVYVTAFRQSDRALVEVVIENGKIDALNSSVKSKPADADYAGATVSIAGTSVATVNSSAAPTGTHQAFRAWYCKRWIGGDPDLRVTPRHTDLQRHPLFWRCDQRNTADLSSYAKDAYAPWSTGRHRAANMAGTGDDDSIGPLPAWEARALQSGDHRCWRAAEANALAILSYNVNYRDRVTGLVPDSARMPGKWNQDDPNYPGNWPRSTDSAERATWEQAHQPAAGLMAFLSRPSPVFIELAQKIAVMTGTLNNSPGRLALFDSAAVGLTDMTGITPIGQARGFAWGMRQTLHATFLSPDGSSWRSGGKVWLGRIARMGRACQQYSLATLNIVLGPYAGVYGDHEPALPGYQTPEWMNNFIVGEAHKIASLRLCTGIEQTYMKEFADWVAQGPVRFVNEQPDGGWRYVPYSAGYLAPDRSTFADYAQRRNNDLPGWAPPSVAGQWYGYPTNKTTAADVDSSGFESTAQDFYNCQLWYGLVAAVERGVPGAGTAWATVQNNITNLSTWRQGFSTRPRWGAYPRNL